MSRIQQAFGGTAFVVLFLASSVSAFAKIPARETDRSELSDLIQALEDGDWFTQVYAINGLINMHPPEAGLEALPALVWVLQDGNNVVRAQAAYALGSFGPKAEAAVPALMQLLKRQDFEDRLAAADALVKIRGSSPEVKSVAMEALKDQNWTNRARAMGVLGQLGLEAKEAVPVLVEALKDVRVRRQAIEALGLIGHVPKEVVPAVTEILEHDENEFTRSEAAKVLGRMGPAAKDAAPSLVRAMEDLSPHVRSEAVKALSRMKLLHTVVPISHFIERLKDKDSVRRREAAMALAEIGPPAKEAIPALLWMLRRDLYGLRVHAAYALVMIGYKEQEVVAPMIETLNRYTLTPEFEAGLLEALKRVNSPKATEAVKSYLERKQETQSAPESQSR